jgi:hypothetical protein
MTMGAIIFGSVGLLFIALGVPLMLRRVKPNVWYGLRSRDTLTDERLWFARQRQIGTGSTPPGRRPAGPCLGVALVARHFRRDLPDALHGVGAPRDPHDVPGELATGSPGGRRAGRTLLILAFSGGQPEDA